MIPDKARTFLENNHSGILSTYKKNGAAQMSLVTGGLYEDGVAFTTTGSRAKHVNMERDPRCTLMVSMETWRGYVVLEGQPKIYSPKNTDAEDLRLRLREVYKVVRGGEEHPNWDEYDQAMRDENRSVIVVVPEKVYGHRSVMG
jgi:PPOX class probable F420-dependent enzyme